MNTFNCDECSKKYNKKQKLMQHMEKEHDTKHEKTADYECGQCNKKFTQSKNLIQHLKTVQRCQTYAKLKQCKQIYGDNSSCARNEEDSHFKQSFPRRLNAVWSYKRNKLLESFFTRSGYKRTTKLMFSPLLRSISIAELVPLKNQLSVFVQMLKPIDDSKVGCHANTKFENFNNRTIS